VAASQTAASIDSLIKANQTILRADAEKTDFETYLNMPPEQRQNTDLETQLLDTLSALHRGQDNQFHLDSYGLLDINGRNILDTKSNNIGDNEGDRLYFQKAIQTGRSSVSPVNFPERAGGIYFHVSVPIRRHRIGEVIGVLRARYSLSILQELVFQSENLAGAKSFAILLDENYLILAHGTESTILFKLVTPLSDSTIVELKKARYLPSRSPDKIEANLPDLANGLANLDKSQFFVAKTQHDNPNQVEQVAVVKLKTVPWLIVFSQPHDIFLAPVERQTKNTLWLVLIITMGVITAAVVSTRILIRPIIRLTDVTRRVMEGDFNAWQPLHEQITISDLEQNRDEINVLTFSFNQMLEQLTDLLSRFEEKVEHRTHAIRTSAEMGQHIIAILSLEDLLKYIVDSIQEAFNMSHICIYLADKTSSLLVMVEGTEEIKLKMEQDDYRIPLSHKKSLVAQVARTGKFKLVKNVKASSYSSHPPLPPNVLSEIAVPIIVDDDVVGVLDVQQDKVNGLDESDADLFLSLANQIGIAIQNARLYTRAKNELTERKRAEHALQQANEELAKLNVDKDKLFSIIAHDLRAPFMPLLGMSELLPTIVDESTDYEIIKEMAHSIHESAKNIYSLLENLLQWSRIQRGHISYQPQTFHLHKIVQNIIQLLSLNAGEKNITLQNLVSEDISIYADKTMLETVIRNLTSNAIKFTPSEGNITIETKVNIPNFIEIAVIDTGIGMSQEMINTLFKVEHHHTTLGTNKEKGTGLGLLICKELIENNGGTIWLESKQGQGTCVSFTVPCDEAQPSTLT